MFYLSSTMGEIIVIDVRNCNRMRTYKGHAAPINDFIEVVQHKMMVTAGDDFCCNVYDLSKEPDSMKPKVKKTEEEEKKE